MQQIIIPTQLKKYSIREVVIAFRKYVDNPDEDRKIVLDLTKVTFIEPSGVIALNNIVQWAMDHNEVMVGVKVKSEMECQGRNRDAMEYLADCGFFLSIGQPNAFKSPCTRPTMLRVKDLATTKVEQWKLTDLKKWLQLQTGRSNEFTSICTAIDEIFNNISDHSQEKIGCIFGQYYPTKTEIIIAVSDFGIGIPQSVKNRISDTNFYNKLQKFAEKKEITLEELLQRDNYLIEFALTEGVSTESLPQNRGAGLANIKKVITTNQVGEFTIISNCGILGVRDNEIVLNTTLEESYPGTFFEIKIDTSNDCLYDQDIEEEFEW
ncbi:STAS domain-containing protein [Lactococcus petauri]|uniref:ATP-binding protein n=1 Tax=Lactococcus petauri TaxID=1940789 RepID=UPI003851EB8F